MEHLELLHRTAELAGEFLATVGDRPVGAAVDPVTLREALGGALPDHGEDARAVVERLARAADAGLIASAGPRYFGLVIGGSHPAALAADWLTGAWDQNAALYITSPAAAVVEEVAGRWLVDLFGLPADTSVGFTTGATMATFTALAAARHAVLARAGWDVEEHGLAGAPAIDIVVGEEVHVTVLAALQMLGLGRGRVRRVATDRQGGMRADALRAALATATAPLIVCAQSGNVNSGACDPLAEIASAVRAADGWLHVDGAFGMWAAVTPALRSLVAGLELADSWTVDGHKWLNVPYDSGIVLVRDRAAHHAAMTLGGPYYGATPDGARDNYNWAPESSRRARGFAVYAALRALGRSGVADLVERCCALARRMADLLRRSRQVEILNDVVLNQVLVRFTPGNGGDPDAWTREVVRRVQADGTCWLGGTSWHGMTPMRISVSSWCTTEADIDASAAAILRCAEMLARA